MMDFLNNKKNNKKKKKKNAKEKIFSQIITIFFILALMIMISTYISSQKDIEEINISQLATLISERQIKEIQVELNKLKIIKKDETELKGKKEFQGTLTETLRNLEVSGEDIIYANIKTIKPSGFFHYFSKFLPFLFPILLLALIIYFIVKQSKGGMMQAFSFGTSKARFIDPKDKKNRITFKDVAGAKEAKEELIEVVDFLKSPQKYFDIGAEIPKGLLMMGAPGTGKTLLARAVAGEAEVPFFSVSGSEFVEMFVGVGASRVRDLFGQAKKMSPSIIFIDEIDAIGRVRGTGVGGGNDEREQTLNQILTEMDGFEKNQKVIVIAATNRPEVLDPALLRPGRFDRRVHIDLPDKQDREKILDVHGKKKPFEKNIDLKVIAERTPGFSGADLQSLMNEGAILAAREERKKLSQNDLLISIEKVMLGPERKSHLMSREDKIKTAYHEVGHALVSSLLEYADPVHKISIIPRGRVGGYTMNLPFDDRKMQTKNNFLAQITTLLGGYVTEKIVFGDVSTGPSNDLKVASEIVRAMVMRYGMSEKAGLISYDGTMSGISQVGADRGSVAKISSQTALLIDTEVKRIIDEQYKIAENLLKKHEEALHGISEVLIKKEVLERAEFENLLEKYKIKVKKKEDVKKMFKIKKKISKKITKKNKKSIIEKN